MSRGLVAMIETGRTTPPLDTLDRICEVLDLTPIVDLRAGSQRDGAWVDLSPYPPEIRAAVHVLLNSMIERQ